MSDGYARFISCEPWRVSGCCLDDCVVSPRRRPGVVQLEARFFEGCRRQLEQLECLRPNSLFLEWCEVHPGFGNCTGLLSQPLMPPDWGYPRSHTFKVCHNLTMLNEGNTSLSGNFPEDIVNCCKLVYLNFSWTLINEKFPDNFFKLHHLEVLDLTNAYCKSTLENKFDKLYELQVLHIGMNYFEGQMLESILSLTKLEELALSHNNWYIVVGLLHYSKPKSSKCS